MYIGLHADEINACNIKLHFFSLWIQTSKSRGWLCLLFPVLLFRTFLTVRHGMPMVKEELMMFVKNCYVILLFQRNYLNFIWALEILEDSRGKKCWFICKSIHEYICCLNFGFCNWIHAIWLLRKISLISNWLIALFKSKYIILGCIKVYKQEWYDIWISIV